MLGRDFATAAAIVNFLALLELAREFLIEVKQGEAYAPMDVKLAYSPS